MVINNLNINCIMIKPFKTNSPVVIYSDTILALTITM